MPTLQRQKKCLERHLTIDNGTTVRRCAYLDFCSPTYIPPVSLKLYLEFKRRCVLNTIHSFNEIGWFVVLSWYSLEDTCFLNSDKERSILYNEGLSLYKVFFNTMPLTHLRAPKTPSPQPTYSDTRTKPIPKAPPPF